MERILRKRLATSGSGKSQDRVDSASLIPVILFILSKLLPSLDPGSDDMVGDGGLPGGVGDGDEAEDP